MATSETFTHITVRLCIAVTTDDAIEKRETLHQGFNEQLNLASKLFEAITKAEKKVGTEEYKNEVAELKKEVVRSSFACNV